MLGLSASLGEGNGTTTAPIEEGGGEGPCGGGAGATASLEASLVPRIATGAEPRTGAEKMPGADMRRRPAAFGRAVAFGWTRCW